MSLVINGASWVAQLVKYSWASLVAQTVKNLPAVLETWVRSLGCEDPLEEGKATQSSILAWRIPMDRGAWQATVHRVMKSRTHLSCKAHVASSESFTKLYNVNIRLYLRPLNTSQKMYTEKTLQLMT